MNDHELVKLIEDDPKLSPVEKAMMINQVKREAHEKVAALMAPAFQAKKGTIKGTFMSPLQQHKVAPPTPPTWEFTIGDPNWVEQRCGKPPCLLHRWLLRLALGMKIRVLK